MSFDALETAKQLEILNAACEVFAKHGYRKASMKDIAESAGVSKCVLFKYFETKENLYVRIFRLATDGILEWLPQENILFAGTHARLSTQVDLDPGARFIGWEIQALGRPAIVAEAHLVRQFPP